MAAVNTGIEVCLDTKFADSPHCPHGPTLLFERCTHGEVKRYYACSACRDRKDCSFFQWEEEKVSKQKQRLREESNRRQQPPHTQQEYWRRSKLFRKLPIGERQFCQDCGLLLLPDDAEKHDGHTILDRVSHRQLRSPSQLLTPLDNNKKNAQYLFSSKAVDFTIETLESLGFTKILCVGAPRIHEGIMQRKSQTVAKKLCGDTDAERSNSLTSLLLDIDHRYAQFYSPKHFCHYNMFNHHFFGSKRNLRVFSEFVQCSNSNEVVMVTDPPFGGLIEVLAHNVKKISHVWNSESEGSAMIPMFWYFPYFMEPRMLSCLPSLTMLDYKVDYENHSVFQEGPKGRKHGSPVRIFTNIPASTITLPQTEGYRFCEFCQRYVAPENLHCDICGICPSKDGHTYKHCDECGRCVKPSRVHCDACKQCMQQDHKCGQIKTTGCYICGELGHKRRECPKKSEIFQGRKRKKKMESKKLKKIKKH